MKPLQDSKHFLVVDNYTKMLGLIKRRLDDDGHTFTVVRYDPERPLYDGGHDAIILSGGYVHEVEEMLPDGRPWFEHEFELIRRTNKPILGICLGLQMVTVALHGSLQQLPESIETPEHVKLELPLSNLFQRDSMHLYESHQWAIDQTAPGFDVLLQSDTCIEMIQHRTRPIIGTQFHPEASVPQFRALTTHLFGQMSNQSVHYVKPLHSRTSLQIVPAR